jgi:uncharacterized membrane protein
MSERCDICGARMASHSCYRCEKNVCSSCIDENDFLCKNCKKGSEMEGIQIGFAPLRKIVNLPLFATGIAILITGMVIIMWSPLTAPNIEQLPQQQEPRGFIYIFPLPFVFGLNSQETTIMLPIILAIIALPIIAMLLMFRKFTRF